MGKEKREVFDYYQGEDFLFRFGYVQFKEASCPMDTHTHDSMTEFVFLEKGSQKYQVEGREYVIYPGEIFTTYPYEQHSTGSSPEEKASLYYLIVDLEKVLEKDWACAPQDRENLQLCFREAKQRIQKSPSGLMEDLEQMRKITEKEQEFKETRIRNALSEILLRITEGVAQEENGSMHHMEKSCRYICEHVGEEISLELLAEMENMSLSTFKYHFRKETGIPPGEYILREKIERAKQQLADSARSITEIAYSCGFSSSQYFATVFRRFCYVTPTQFREKCRKC